MTCGTSSYSWSIIIFSHSYYLRVFMYFSTPYGWSHVGLIYFGGTISGGSFPYIRFDGMSTTIFLCYPKGLWNVKYDPFLIRISLVLHTASICFVPIVPLMYFILERINSSVGSDHVPLSMSASLYIVRIHVPPHCIYPTTFHVLCTIIVQRYFWMWNISLAYLSLLTFYRLFPHYISVIIYTS